MPTKTATTRKPFTLKKGKAKDVSPKAKLKYTQESVAFLLSLNEKFRADQTYWRINPYGDIKELVTEGKAKLKYLKGTIKQIEQAVQKMEEFSIKQPKQRKGRSNGTGGTKK